MPAMPPLWIDDQTLFGIKVEKHESPRSGGKPYYPMDQTGIGVCHTTEGSSVAGALAMLSQNFDASHFVVGEDRIIQCRPLGVQAAALHSPQNQFAELQIECVGFSQQHLWLFDEWDKHTYQVGTKQVPIPIPKGSTLKPLAALMAWAVQNRNIPLVRPSADWQEDMSDVKPFPSSNNSRRTSGVWPNIKGFYGHLEVANQQPSNHWDPGSLRYIDLFAAVNALLNPSAFANVTGDMEGEVTQS